MTKSGTHGILAILSAKQDLPYDKTEWHYNIDRGMGESHKAPPLNAELQAMND